MTAAIEWVRQLVGLVGPPGEEKAVRAWLEAQVRALGYTAETDAKGNLLVAIGTGPVHGPSVLVTAHMDEIALMVKQVEPDGKVRVAAYGGVQPWKWGEGPVDILTRRGPLPAILSFGSVHTEDASSVAEHARRNPLQWDRAYLFTGMESDELEAAGVRPGLRVVLGASRRAVTEFGPFVASYFLDDRADLAAWLRALEMLGAEGAPPGRRILFAATASEETGGEGVQYLLHTRPADVCVALEIGPRTPEADFAIDSAPTIWVRDAYAAMEAIDGEILADCCDEIGVAPHWQYLSRGGSDASCAAARGLTARPVTLGLAVENSHGYEIMHREAPDALARLLLAYLRHLE
jgi:putative aminopeptidase FrvX